MGKAELEASLRTLDIWLIVFGVLVAVGVVGESIAGFLHWRRSNDLETVQSSENLTLQHDIKRLSADADASRAQIAEAQARTTEAQARLEMVRRQLGPRFPNRQAMVPLLKEVTATVEIVYGSEDLGSTLLAQQLRSTLIEAGWTVSALNPVPISELAKRGGAPSWWTLETRSMQPDDVTTASRIGLGLLPDSNIPKNPFIVLGAALLRGLGAPGITTQQGEDPSLPEGHLRLTILPQMLNSLP